MKTSELSGAHLDAAVAKIENRPPAEDFSPSTDWSIAGLLIEREKIHVAPMPGKGWTWCACVVSLDTAGGPDRGAWMEGRTPLIAAMRAYVASKFGRDVPDPS